MDRDIHDIFDVILKIIAEIYGTVFLEYIGIDKKISKNLNVEFTTLKGYKLYLDFLCRLEDGTLCNIEFQYPNAKNRDLDRIFNYNIAAQSKYKCLSETVIFNFTEDKGKTMNKKIGYSKSFHPKTFYLGDVDFGKYINEIKTKVKSTAVNII